ncbi:MAG: class I SAM-dependent methyltransferase [Actinomycetota bacterium]|nr:class I SAM-dependent methyltransferase [Actinomycetota bacterium]
MSSAEGKSWIKDRISSLALAAPLTIVDVGPGVGTYAKLLAGPAVTRMIGIEVWEPYVHTYRLRDYYDELIIGDVRTVPVPAADVVILGDVAEHMSAGEAADVWAKCARAARRAVYLSIPIVHYPQQSIEENPYEVHVEEDWNHEKVMAHFAGIGASWVGDEVGVYERRTDRA